MLIYFYLSSELLTFGNQITSFINCSIGLKSLHCEGCHH